MEKDLERKYKNNLKIVLIGPESTGKTTLAKKLAEYYNTTWVKEFIREFAENIKKESNRSIEISDTNTIIENQLQLEVQAESISNGIVFYDTNLFQTMIYSEIYFNNTPIELLNQINNSNDCYYLLTNIDVPWKDDGVRDASEFREIHYNFFKKMLMEHNKPFTEISGSKHERLDQAIQVTNYIEFLLTKGFVIDDFKYLQDRGIELKDVVNQINLFENGIPFVNLYESASINNGIIRLSEEQNAKYISVFDSEKENYQLEKFVPASGAASRMFAFLSKFLIEFDINKQSINHYINAHKAYELKAFFIGLEKFPFYKEIKAILKRDFSDYKSWPKDKYYHKIVQILLSKEYLNYCELPKGVIPFHKTKTPVNEHLVEATEYSNSNNKIKIHYTISEQHQKLFNKVLDKALEANSDYLFDVDFSYQKSSTDTLVVHLNKQPYRDENGQLLFRQAGHGALLENLNDLNSDIVFIKNIDNVSGNYFNDIIIYKKVLAGYLISIQSKVFNYLNILDSTTEINIDEIIDFCLNSLNIKFKDDFYLLDNKNKLDVLKHKLNRPIRVCGMVKNEGEPGGGPFWVANSEGEISLQIIETSQIDKTIASQKAILDGSTHFNPVDLVCGIKNYKGEKFNLINFRDNNTGFLTDKTISGTPIIGMELPGLWNGAMSNWISIFIEVPLTTFNPVKTINDLLKPSHQ